MTIPEEPRQLSASADSLPPGPQGYSAAPNWRVDPPNSYQGYGPPAVNPSFSGYPPAMPPQYPPTGPSPMPYPAPYPIAPVIVQTAPANGLGVAGFVTGLLGLILFWVPVLGLILGALGIILGGVAISASRKLGASNGLGIAGLVLGIVALVPAFLVLVALSNSTPSR